MPRPPSHFTRLAPLRCVHYFGLDPVVRFRFNFPPDKVWHCDGPDEATCREWVARANTPMLPSDLVLLGWDPRRHVPSWLDTNPVAHSYTFGASTRVNMLLVPKRRVVGLVNISIDTSRG